LRFDPDFHTAQAGEQKIQFAAEAMGGAQVLFGGMNAGCLNYWAYREASQTCAGIGWHFKRYGDFSPTTA